MTLVLRTIEIKSNALRVLAEFRKKWSKIPTGASNSLSHTSDLGLFEQMQTPQFQPLQNFEF
jgi:hypothetical protein